MSESRTPIKIIQITMSNNIRVDIGIMRGYPKHGQDFCQGITWTIVETQDGFLVENHCRSMWKGSSSSHGMFVTDALAEKFIREKVKQDGEEKLAREKKRDLEKAAKLMKKWKT